VNESVETLVIGAGISGMAYAYERLKQDPSADLRVVDGSDRAGGLVLTVRVDDPLPVSFEAGPETISDPSGRARILATELNLERVQASASKRFLVHKSQLIEAPTSPGAFMKSPILPLRARLRALREPLCTKGVALNGSIADFVRHRLGSVVLDTLVDPLVAGIHASSPEQLSLRACFPSLAEGVEKHGSITAYMKSQAGKTEAQDRRPWKPAQGMGALTAALAARLGSSLRLGNAVLDLRRSECGEHWEAHLQSGGIHARRVVLALPIRATECLLQRCLPAVSDSLSAVQCESLTVVAHAYRRTDVRHALDGFGYLVASQSGLMHLGTLFSSTLNPGAIDKDHVLLRTMLGGSRPRPELDAGDGQILTLVQKEVGPLLGIKAKPVFSAVRRHQGALPRYDLDHPSRLRRLQEQLPGDLNLLGNHQRGIGLSALLKDASTLALAHGSEHAVCGPAQAGLS